MSGMTAAQQIIEAAKHLNSLVRQATSPAPGTPSIAPEELDTVSLALATVMASIAGALDDSGHATGEIVEHAEFLCRIIGK